MFEADVAVFEFFGAEAFDGVAEGGFRVGEGGGLLLVVFVDGFLDGDGAGHGGAGAEGGGGGAEGVSGEVPEGEERGGADAAFGDEGCEGVEVDLFLGLHVADDVALVGAAEDGELALVDAFGAVFAGVVDADEAFDHGSGGEVAGEGVRGGHANVLGRMAAVARVMVNRRERARFMAAMLMGRAGMR